MIIPLTQGRVAVIDDGDCELVRPYRWYAHADGRNYYAMTHQNGNHNYSFTMHRLILGFPNYQIDHRDGDGLNNRRFNLRPSTHSFNQANKRTPISNKSGHKGVIARGNTFYSQIKKDGKTYYLGTFGTFNEAKEAYAVRARELFGEFTNV